MPDDENQQLSYNSVPISQDSVQTLYIQKERLVVPIVFLPGIMGSNLREKTESYYPKTIWRLDDMLSPAGWALPKYGNAAARKLELDPEKTTVDNRGMVVEAWGNDYHKEEEYSSCPQPYSDSQYEIDKYLECMDEIQKQNNPEYILFGSRYERGWGTVCYYIYGKFLEELQESLFEPKGFTPPALNKLIQAPLFTLDKGSKELLTLIQEQIDHCNNFYFPVHAMGYNWLKSNADSANDLKELIEITLPNYYKDRHQTCDKVILVTHSMGGLVARYYTQVLGGATKVYGVINGVQPSIGAAATYTRMKRGTEVHKFVTGPITENVLGKDAEEMTVVCAQSPGPLQLLPTPEYGMGWLTITDPDKHSESYPKSDPYTEIYLAKDKWWCLCEPHLINPFNTDHDLERMKKDWKNFEDIIKLKVKTFNEAIANKYHPNTYAFFGIENDEQNIQTKYLTYETVHWIGRLAVGYSNQMKEPAKDHIGDQNRLDLSELKALRTIMTNDHNWSITDDVSVSNGANDVYKGYINKSYLLQSAKDNGDGTVPRRSGEIPIDFLQSRMHLATVHDEAFNSNISREFTLRAIVNILQQVTVND